MKSFTVNIAKIFKNFRACGGLRGNLITPSRTRPPVGPRQVVPTHCCEYLWGHQSRRHRIHLESRQAHGQLHSPFPSSPGIMGHATPGSHDSDGPWIRSATRARCSYPPLVATPSPPWPAASTAAAASATAATAATASAPSAATTAATASAPPARRRPLPGRGGGSEPPATPRVASALTSPGSRAPLGAAPAPHVMPCHTISFHVWRRWRWSLPSLASQAT